MKCFVDIESFLVFVDGTEAAGESKQFMKGPEPVTTDSPIDL